MPYAIKQLADLANISVRTLHFYDQIGLLKPAGTKRNGYRYYEEPELLQLQQILFFRELDFPLDEIRRIMVSKSFDMRQVLRDQRKLIELKKQRLKKLLITIDATIKKINNEIIMNDQDLYGNFSKEEMERYTEQARQRWGNTQTFKQSQERVKKMGKEGLRQVMKKNGELTEAIAACMRNGNSPTSDLAQQLIVQHYDGLRAFYEPNLEIYRGLATMYVADERFKANYEKVAPGLAQFMSDAMIYFVDHNGIKTEK